MPASWWIDVLHGMRLSIRDYRVSPREQVRVRALPRSLRPIERLRLAEILYTLWMECCCFSVVDRGKMK